MVTCQNCGQVNPDDCNFCRFCGTKLSLSPQPQQAQAYNFAPPRPYAWKTDEFQTQNEARSDPRSQPPAPYQPAYPTVASGYAYASDVNYRCPRCGTTYLPVMERRVSTAGWIVFSVLLVFTLIFFWIGLLMKENVAVCPVCRTKLS